MRLLVLGGTTFVGRWVVTAAVERDWHVTTFTRGRAGWAHPDAEAVIGDRAVLARAGLILGPHENAGRLPHWLLRAARGGEMLAPGPADQPFRYVDVRDLAAWILDAAEGGVTGPVNLVNPEGHTTTRNLLESVVAVTGGRAELVWVDPEAIESAGIDRWAELPGWIPPGPERAGLIRTDVGRALATGLRCRPVVETVADTWAWLTGSGGIPASPPGIDPAKERAVIAAWRRSIETSPPAAGAPPAS